MRKQVFVGSMLLALAASGAWAADASHPYSNVNRAVDAGNATGDNETDRLNQQELQKIGPDGSGQDGGGSGRGAWGGAPGGSQGGSQGESRWSSQAGAAAGRAGYAYPPPYDRPYYPAYYPPPPYYAPYYAYAYPAPVVVARPWGWGWGWRRPWWGPRFGVGVYIP